MGCAEPSSHSLPKHELYYTINATGMPAVDSCSQPVLPKLPVPGTFCVEASMQALCSSQSGTCRFELSLEARSLDPQLLSGHAIAAKLYHDSPDLSNAQPVLESTLDLVGQGPDTSDRMAGSQADWHIGAAKATCAVLVLCCAVLCCAVLCCAVLCCAVLCCAVLCCAVLCCAVLCCAVLCCAVLCCAVLCCAVLCCAVLCCVVLCLCRCCAMSCRMVLACVMIICPVVRDFKS